MAFVEMEQEATRADGEHEVEGEHSDQATAAQLGVGRDKAHRADSQEGGGVLTAPITAPAYRRTPYRRP